MATSHTYREQLQEGTLTNHFLRFWFFFVSKKSPDSNSCHLDHIPYRRCASQLGYASRLWEGGGASLCSAGASRPAPRPPGDGQSARRPSSVGISPACAPEGESATQGDGVISAEQARGPHLDELWQASNPSKAIPALFRLEHAHALPVKPACLCASSLSWTILMHYLGFRKSGNGGLRPGMNPSDGHCNQ